MKNLQDVVERLMASGMETVHSHTLHPLLASTTLRVPAGNKADVLISFVTEELANLVLDVAVG